MTATASVSRLIFQAESLESECLRLKEQLKNALTDLEESNARRREVDKEMAALRAGSRKNQSAMHDEMSSMQSKLDAMSCRVSEQQRLIDQMRDESEGSLIERDKTTLDSERHNLRLSALLKEKEIELCMVQDQNNAQWKLIEALEAEQRSLKSDLTSLTQQSKDHLDRISRHQVSVQASIVQSDELVAALGRSVERMNLAIEESEVAKKKVSELEAVKTRATLSNESLKKEMQVIMGRMKQMEERLAAERVKSKEMMELMQREKGLLIESLVVQRDQREVILQLRKERDDAAKVPVPPLIPLVMPAHEVQIESAVDGPEGNGLSGEEEEGEGGEEEEEGEGIDATEMMVEGKGEGSKGGGGGSEAISPPSLVHGPETAADAPPLSVVDPQALAHNEEEGSQRKKPRLNGSGSDSMKSAVSLNDDESKKGRDEMEVAGGDGGGISDESDPQVENAMVLGSIFASMKKV